MSFSTVKMQLAVSYSLNMLHRLLTGSEQQVQQNFFSLNIFFMQKPHNEYQALSCYIYPFTYPSIRSVKLLSCVQSFATPWTAARQASLFNTNSPSLLKLMSMESVMLSNHLILCGPLLSCPQSFPASGSFPVSVLRIRWPKYRSSASASVLPMNIQD